MRERTTMHAASRTALTLASLLLVAAAIGCAPSFKTTQRLDASELGATPAGLSGPAVDIENFRGNVEVRVDPRADQVRVDATVRGFDSAKHFDEGLLRRLVSVETTTETMNGLPVVVIRGVSEREQDDHAADIKVTMPAVGGVRVQTTDGSVELVGVGGAVEARTTRGTIQYRTGERLTEPVTLFTGEGEIYCQITPDSTGLLRLETGRGSAIVNNLASGVRLTEANSTMNATTARLNGGENPVSLTSGRGDVRVFILRDPLARTRMFPGRFD